MHPSLNTAALLSLPPALRKSAFAALGGTSADLLKMIREAKNGPKSTWILLLPVFYAHLNPAKAQQLQPSEVLGSADAELVLLAFLAVHGLNTIGEIPQAACPDIWPGLWQWTQLMMQHHYCIPAHVIKHPREGPILAFIVMGRIYRICDDACRKAIAAEPGTRVTVARVWAILSRDNEWTPGLQIDAYAAVLDFINVGMDLQNRQHHDDLVEGSGGSLRDLATVIVNFVPYIMTKETRASNQFLIRAMSIIRETDQLREGFRDLVLQRGIVTAFVIALRKMTTHALLTPGQALDDGFKVLISLVFQSRYHLWFIESLRAGFLRLFASALENPQLITLEVLRGSILSYLTLFLPYRSVLVELRWALADMDAHMDLTRARGFKAWDAWKSFMEVYNLFLSMVAAHDSRDRVPMRACDNVECDLVSVKGDLKRCACCESVYYCSTDCQRLDWMRGHRKTCAAIRAHSLENPDSLTSRDRSFFRTIVHEVYKMQTLNIFMSQLGVMKESPMFPKECVTILKYAKSGFVIRSSGTDPNLELDDQAIPVGPMWEDQLSRAVASNHRIHLHIIEFPQAEGRLLAQIVPVRRPNAAVWDRLHALVPELPDGELRSCEWSAGPEVTAKLEALILETGAKDVVY
ncbi:hypothetical protein FB45DRAFT_1069186 [Roridomyces roridus]|uniref:MYND-type domain-containing protein n=1 Tax=Roridomyces roridus TaxID=1738132 RepID=A0AAD7AZG4_9AGAR|nr:hypothetical protein FB45DRAFT_1069186 [Roridomyces roridus]